MSKYSPRNKPERPKLNKEIHPVMRGIGCIMMVVVPVLSYVASVLIVNTVPLPLLPSMTRPIDIPNWMYFFSGLQSVFLYIENQPLLVAYLVLTLIIGIFLFTILAIVYGFMYKAFGPSQYGPTDAPPIRKKVKKYTR